MSALSRSPGVEELEEELRDLPLDLAEPLAKVAGREGGMEIFHEILLRSCAG
jgi:hypothetical protein